MALPNPRKNHSGDITVAVVQCFVYCYSLRSASASRACAGQWGERGTEGAVCSEDAVAPKSKRPIPSTVEMSPELQVAQRLEDISDRDVDDV